MNIENAPNDIHEFIGYRLPDELYYYLMRGLMGPQSINSLVSGVLIESAPLDNGESIEYHNFLTQLLNIRTQTLSLLTQPLHPFYKTRKVSSYFWFEPTEEQIMHHQPILDGANRVEATPLNTIYEKTSSWNVTKAFIDTELKAQQSNTIDIKFCVHAVDHDQKASKTISHPHPETPLVEKNEIVANVLWKTLEIRDFLTSSKHIYTPWGQAFATALNTLPNSTQTTQEALLTALELIRFEVLTNNEYSKTYSHPLGDGKFLSHWMKMVDHELILIPLIENQKKHIILLSRALSLLPMDLKVTKLICK